MQIIPFEYESKQIRVIQDENGEPWWVAKDVCQALELRDTGRAIQSLDKDESKTFRVTDKLGREQESYIINEPGLYRCWPGQRRMRPKSSRDGYSTRFCPRSERPGSMR